MTMNDEHKRFVRLENLPWETKDADIHAFFRPLKIVFVRAIPSTDENPPSQAYVRFESPDTIGEALKRNRSKMGRRLVDIFDVKHPDELQRMGSDSLDSAVYKVSMDRFHQWERQRRAEDGFVVRLRGLPYDVSSDAIQQFFQPLRVDQHDIVFPKGRHKDLCFVKLRSVADVKQAIQKHRQYINARYVEVFPASLRETESNGGNSGNDGGMRRGNDQSPGRDMNGAARNRSPPRRMNGSRNRSPPRRMDGPRMNGDRDRSPVRGMNGDNSGEQNRRDVREREFRDGHMMFEDRVGTGDQSHQQGSSPHIQHEQPRRDVQGRHERREDRNLPGRDDMEQYLAYTPRSHGLVEVHRSSVPLGCPSVFKIRGVSYHHTIQDVMDFLAPVVPDAVYIVMDQQQRPAGDVFFELAGSEQDERSVLSRHKGLMPKSKRYIEVFRCTPNELYARVRAKPVNQRDVAPPPHQLSSSHMHPPHIPLIHMHPPHNLPYSPAAPPIVHPAVQVPPIIQPPTAVLPTLVLRVRGLPPSTVARESDVIAYFSQGSCAPTALHRNETQGFLEFASDRDCHMAVQLTRFPLMNYPVEALIVPYNEMASIVGLPLRYVPQNGPPPHIDYRQPAPIQHPSHQHFNGQYPPYSAPNQQQTVNHPAGPPNGYRY